MLILIVYVDDMLTSSKNKAKDGNLLILILYVDDMLIAEKHT